MQHRTCARHANGSIALLVAVSGLFGLCPARAYGEDFAGDLGALISGGVVDAKPLLGGEVRGGLYYLLRDSTSLVLGNRLGGELRWHQYYSASNGAGPLGHLLLGAAPSFSYEFSELYRRAPGTRIPSLLGLLTPEAGIWLRTTGVPLGYLAWRAPFVLLPSGEAGLECAPAFTWAPAGAWLATLSVGGFLR